MDLITPANRPFNELDSILEIVKSDGYACLSADSSWSENFEGLSGGLMQAQVHHAVKTIKRGAFNGTPYTATANKGLDSLDLT